MVSIIIISNCALFFGGSTACIERLPMPADQGRGLDN